jgi:hypothetical protein
MSITIEFAAASVRFYYDHPRYLEPGRKSGRVFSTLARLATSRFSVSTLADNRIRKDFSHPHLASRSALENMQGVKRI